MIIIGSMYEHYKGKKYKVLALGRHTETLEEYVVYQALYHDEKFGNNAIWIRPLAMFTESIVIEGLKQPRFKECNL